MSSSSADAVITVSPTDYTIDVSQNDVSMSSIEAHLSTMYNYGAKSSSSRNFGPFGKYSDKVVKIGMLHNVAPSDPNSALEDISFSMVDNTEYDFTTLDYRLVGTIEPNSTDVADLYCIPIWHISSDGYELHTNFQQGGLINVHDKLRELTNYARKYMIIVENAINYVSEHYGEPDQEPTLPEPDQEPTLPEPDQEPTSPEPQPKAITLDNALAYMAERNNTTLEITREKISTSIQSFLENNPDWSLLSSGSEDNWLIILGKNEN